MKVELETEDLRWQVMKSMLDEFPSLREKVRKYLKTRVSRGTSRVFANP